MEFDLPLKVSGTPVLYLETGDSDTEVEYAGMLGDYKLVFQYVVEDGHMAGNLTYADKDSVLTFTAYVGPEHRSTSPQPRPYPHTRTTMPPRPSIPPHACGCRCGCTELTLLYAHPRARCRHR